MSRKRWIVLISVDGIYCIIYTNPSISEGRRGFACMKWIGRGKGVEGIIEFNPFLKGPSVVIMLCEGGVIIRYAGTIQSPGFHSISV